MSLCRWPKRNRHGDIIDLASFWVEIHTIFEKITLSTKKPDVRAWVTFIEGLHYSAKYDPSLWNLVAIATKTILNSYPNEFLGKRDDLTPAVLKDLAKKFIDDGATIIGGCCETNPSHIKAFSELK